jgi:hypothetical protein
MLEGEINEINLVERLVELWREQFTGAIRFENDGIIKIIYFKGGDVLSASTNDRADSVDEILMRAGKVSREHVKQALAKRKENETLGDALLNLGFITRKELTWARRVQVVGVVRSITAWPAGQFTIVADYLPKRDEGTLFPLPQVLVELIVTDQDRQKFERAMDGGNAVYAKTAEFDDVFRKLGLNEQAEGIVSQIDGEKSVAQVATASGGDSFNVYKLLNALATLRVLNRVDSATAQPEFTLDDEESGASYSWNEPEQPQPSPSPTFDLDEAEALQQPTLEIQAPPQPEQPSSASAWDEEEDATAVAPEPPPISEEKMPAWDVPPRTPAPAPIPVPVPPAAEAEEEQWGFDDAQVETVRRASTPSTPKPSAPKKGGRRYGLIVALLVIFILALAGYAGFVYWQKYQEPAAPEAVVRRPVRRQTPPPVATETIVPVATTTTAAVETMATTTQATTTTQAPPPATASAPPPETSALPRIIPKPAPAVASTTPPPVNVSTDAVRARYDAMARDFATNAAGNFTVQIQILCEPSNIAKVLSTGGSNIWFVPQQIKTRSCYRVFWGHYNTRDEAQRAMAAIPASLRDPSAAVKPVPKG